jgi:hypothetical protein
MLIGFNSRVISPFSSRSITSYLSYHMSVY